MKPELSGYVFLERLGTGGHGEVWCAEKCSLKQIRAVKFLPADRLTPENIRRLQVEARVMASLGKHPNRALVYEFQVRNGNGFLSMEYIEGGPLSRKVPLSWTAAMQYAIQVASGLADMHQLGMLHRDIKPSNILWNGRSDEAVLGDFGVAAHVDRARDLGGTPGYMAPEALVCRPSPKSDVFSLAATLFHLLSGFPPFSEDQHQNLIEASAGRVRTLPTASAIPAPVQDTIRAGLLPNAEHRPELDAFKTRLADAWSQVLAQNLLRRARSLPHTVSLTVSVFRHQESQSALQLIRVFESSQDHGPTNLPEISVRTGDELLFKIAVGAKGHLAVLDFGSSGQMQVFKLKAERAGGLIQPGKSVCQALRLTGPPGIDRFAVVWSRDPMDWGADAWRRCLAGSNHLQQPPNELNRDAQMLGPPVVTTPSSALTCVAFAISHGT